MVHKEVNSMPKKLNVAEKDYIKKRLKEEALKCLTLYGIKKTTVDELVKRVNIPKGTFYLFYESKELLFFDAMNEMHDTIQKNLFKELEQVKDGITVEGMTDFLFQLYQEVNLSGLIPILVNGDLEYLMRKLPENVVKEHQLYDDSSMEQLFALLCPRKQNIEAFSGAFRAIFLSMSYRREIGDEIMDDVIRLMIRGMVLQLLD